MLPISAFHLTFLLFDGFSNMVLASAIEPLRAARDLSGRRLFSWQTASLSGQPVTSSSRLSMGVDLMLERVAATDALVIVAGYGVRNHLRRDTLHLVLARARGRRLLAGLDTGTWILAQAGLLTGRRATIHWMEQAALAEAFPETEVVAAPYVTDGNTVTCGGAQGVLAWSLDLIGAHADEALRFDVEAMFSPPLPSQASMPPTRMTDRALPPPLQRAIRRMRENIETPCPVARIAEAAALSPRTLDRRFHALLGMTAGQYYRLIRLSHARALALESGATLDEIAARTGFASAATLARAYRAHFGHTIRATRRDG